MIWWIRITISGDTPSNLIGIGHDEAVSQVTGGKITESSADPRAVLGLLLDPEALERPGVLVDVGLVAGEQLEEHAGRASCRGSGRGRRRA
jgi:hypothetical protein